MKKALAILLTLACLAAVLLVPAYAEADKVALFKEGVDWLYPFCDSFDSNSLPYEFITIQIRNACYQDAALAQYCTYTYSEDDTEQSWPLGAVCEVPADVLEAYVGEHFTNKEALLELLRRESNVGGIGCLDAMTYADGVYRIELVFGGWGDLYPELYYIGYKDLGSNSYEVYFYLVASWIEVDYDYQDYVPGADEVEGVDYLVYTTTYDGVTTTQYGRITEEGIRAVMTVENDNFAFTSYEKVETATIPADTLTKEEDSPVVETKKDGVTLTVAPEEVPVGTTLQVATVTDTNEITRFNACLTDGETVVAAYNFTALDKDAATIENFQATVTVRLPIPAGVTNPVLYYISDDGNTVEEIPGTVEGSEYVCTLSHFSTYVLAQKESGEQGDDLNPDTGDSTLIFAAVSLASLMALAVVVLKDKKQLF